MRELRTYRIYCASRAVTPLTHNEGSEGNETLIRTDEVLFDGAPVRVPSLSGNALRHRMVREPAALWLIEALELEGKVTLDQAAFLLHGGALVRGSATESMRRVRRLWDALPITRVLGGCLPDLLVAGTLQALPGVLVCRENAWRLPAYLPDGWHDARQALPPAARYVGRYQYTRRDARRTTAGVVCESEDGDGDGAGESVGAMIYAGQAVTPGAVFLHGFTLRSARERDLGALLHAMQRFCEAPTIGGMAGRGHGRLETWWRIEPDVDEARLVRDYEAYVAAHAEEARAVLAEEFDPAKVRPKKGGKRIRRKAKADG